MRTKLADCDCVSRFAGLVPAAVAHHAFAAEFDVNKPVTLKGTMTKWDMVNPHSWFHIDVKDTRWKSHRVDGRRRQPQYADPSRRHQVHREDRNGADHRGLSGQGRDEQSRRPKLHPEGWHAALPQPERCGSWRSTGRNRKSEPSAKR